MDLGVRRGTANCVATREDCTRSGAQGGAVTTAPHQGKSPVHLHPGKTIAATGRVKRARCWETGIASQENDLSADYAPRTPNVAGAKSKPGSPAAYTRLRKPLKPERCNINRRLRVLCNRRNDLRRDRRFRQSQMRVTEGVEHFRRTLQPADSGHEVRKRGA